MNVVKEIQAAEALSTKAAQKELKEDFDAAFQLYIQATQTFLHLARTLPGEHAKRCRAAAGRSLERAERIKQTKRVRPVATDPHSAHEQSYILDKSALINGLRFPVWRESDGQDEGSISEPFWDPDGQPSLPSALESQSTWRRATNISTQLQSMFEAGVLPKHVIQNMVTNCSVVSAIAVCVGHQRRFGSKLGLSSIYPQDERELPIVSNNGMYAVRLLVNGIWRKVNSFVYGALLFSWMKPVIDNSLPVLTDGRLLGIACNVDGTNVQWPSLLEKAYMKLMGGYDFPGSNSGTDLHALVGWIPEHVHLQSADFQMENTWNRIYQGFSTGHCLVTLGTPMSPTGVIAYGLIPAHDYAVTEMEDDGSEPRISLLDPWRNSEKRNKVSSAQEKEIPSNASLFQSFTWRDTCNLFDTVHVNWDPSRFPRQFHVHGLWKPHKQASKIYRSVSNRLRVFIKGAKSLHEEAWLLLTRHIVGKHGGTNFISLNVVLHDDFRASPQSEKLSAEQTYTNSVHVLVLCSLAARYHVNEILKRRISIGMRDTHASIVASIDRTDVEVGYTIKLLSHTEITLDTKPQEGFYSKELEGALTSWNSGGNFTYPTFMINPQYRLHLQSVVGKPDKENAKYAVRFSVEGPRDLPLNLKIVWSKGQRITEVIEGDVVADTGEYSYGVALGESEMQAGEYTVIVSSFEPRRQGSYELSLSSLHPFELEPIPAEGAGMFCKVSRGAWRPNNSGGAPKFGRYQSNPIVKVTIPSATQIMIRLQLLTSSRSIALNVTLFSMGTDGGVGPEVLTSGQYSDAIAGAFIRRSAVAPGGYLLVPSTYLPKVEAEYQIMVYSTVAGIELG